MEQVIEIQDHQQSTQTSALKQDWLLAKATIQPLPMDRTIDELSKNLTLCAPSGMAEDERDLWLMAAFDEVKDIPAKPFLSATAKARKLADHPAKIVPAIIRESAEWSENLKRTERLRRKAFENESAPRLEKMPPVENAEERAEISEMLSSLTSKLKSNDPDKMA